MTPRQLHAFMDIAISHDPTKIFSKGVIHTDLDFLVDHELITEEDGLYWIASRGRALMALMCRVRKPTLKEVWIDAKGEVIGV